MIAKIDRASPSRMPEVAVRKLAKTAASEPIARARYIRLRSRLTSQSRAVSTAIRAKAAEVTYWLTVRKPVSVTVTRTGAPATNCEDRPEEAEAVLHELRRGVSHPS